ncbi:MAG TPA: hypothetical protein VIP98_02045 [Microlunatus sp.]
MTEFTAGFEVETLAPVEQAASSGEPTAASAPAPTTPRSNPRLLTEGRLAEKPLIPAATSPALLAFDDILGQTFLLRLIAVDHAG